jgi:hypothetical protein
MHPRRGVVAISVVVVLAMVLVRLSPLWPGPSLPAGATSFRITTQAAQLVPNLGCSTALLAPVRISTSGDEPAAIGVSTSQPVSVTWPTGWADWRRNGHAELVERDGNLVVREGDILDGLGGGAGDDGAPQVCVIGD